MEAIKIFEYIVFCYIRAIFKKTFRQDATYKKIKNVFEFMGCILIDSFKSQTKIYDIFYFILKINFSFVDEKTQHKAKIQ